MTFLAILEMTRLRMTQLTQDGPLAPIYIELRVSADRSPRPTPSPSAGDGEPFGDDEEYE